MADTALGHLDMVKGMIKGSAVFFLAKFSDLGRGFGLKVTEHFGTE